MSKEDLMKDVRLPDDFRSDLFAPVINPTVKPEKKEEKPEEKVEEVAKAPAEEEKPAAKKPAATKSAAKTKKTPAAPKKVAQEPVSEDDEEEFIKMTYLLPLRQVEAIRLISFNEGRMNYEILRDIIDEAIPEDIMETAKLRVKNGIAKASRRKK